MTIVAVTLEPGQTFVENTLYGSQDLYRPQAAIPPGEVLREEILEVLG